MRMVDTIARLTLLYALAAPLGAQALEPPDARLVRAAVEAIPIGATVKLRTQNGERVKGVLLSVTEGEIRVKPATRLPERSRLFRFDQIERIARDQDHVSVGKYAGIGSAIGAAVILLLVAGL